MAGYVLRRLGWTLVVLWAIVTLTFIATFYSPIDPARSYAGQRATPQMIERVEAELGLDKSPPVQYVRYVGRILRGDLGASFATSTPVREAIFDRLPATALLALGALIVQLAIGVPAGIVAALHRRQALDRIVLGLSLLGVVTPTFVLGFLLLYLFAFQASWFPLGGEASLHALLLPAFALGVAGAAWYARILRSTVLNILGEDYIRTARAKGLSERIVIGRHVMRNAAGPIVAMVGMDLGVFFGGVLVVEKVFAWPGIGDQAWRAVTFNDVPMVMGTVLVAAFFVTICNLIADLVNAWIDPRVSYG